MARSCPRFAHASAAQAIRTAHGAPAELHSANRSGACTGRSSVGPASSNPPHPRLVVRMVGTLLAEQSDECQVSDRLYFSAGSMAKVDALEGGEGPRELLDQIA